MKSGAIKLISKQRASEVATTLKALAHPERIRIVALLAGGEMTVGDIVAALGTKPSITSQHLGLMKDRGVLACRRDGMRSYYRIHDPRALKLLKCVCGNNNTKEKRP